MFHIDLMRNALARGLPLLLATLRYFSTTSPSAPARPSRLASHNYRALEHCRAPLARRTTHGSAAPCRSVHAKLSHHLTIGEPSCGRWNAASAGALFWRRGRVWIQEAVLYKVLIANYVTHVNSALYRGLI